LKRRALFSPRLDLAWVVQFYLCLLRANALEERVTFLSMKSLISAGLILTFHLAVAPCFGIGYRLPHQDPEAVARGNAFIATADNPSAIYYNPAGITQLEGQHLRLGLYTISAQTRYRSFGGESFETDFKLQPVPQFYYTVSPRDNPFSFGLGVYAPYGLGVFWPENTTFRTLGIEGRLTYVSVNPVVAWQIHPTLSLAIGPTINASRIRLLQGVAVRDDEFKFKGEGVDYGFNAGLRWQPHEKWAFGVSYRSATEVDYSGRNYYELVAPAAATFSAKTKGELHFPQFVMAGISYRPTTNWNVEVFVDWTDWDALDTVTLRPKGLPSIDIPLNWESSFLTGIGITRYFQNRFFVSGGYFFSENSTSERDFSPIVPDTDLHVGSLGFGYRGNRWSWAVAGQLITGPWRTVDESLSRSLVGETADGKYKWFNQAVNVAVGYHF
jgi:long-chain fatty acid transport protein